MAFTKTATQPLQLGDIVPNFTADSTQGPIHFYDWIGQDWCILFSHPKDFTPVCTTELGEAAKLQDEFRRRQTKILAISVGDLATHQKWIPDIEETQKTKVSFPIISDSARVVSTLYGMIHPSASDTMTVRTVFIIDPNKKLRLTMNYPASTGRNFREIVRVLDSLQLTDHHKVATPVNWQWGEECVILPSITDPKELKERFPAGWKEIKPYLRLTPQPNLALQKK